MPRQQVLPHSKKGSTFFNAPASKIDLASFVFAALSPNNHKAMKTQGRYEGL
jgi:hypothetical protein